MKDIREEMNISFIRGVIRVSCSSCASVARPRSSTGYDALHNDDYNRNVPQPCRAYSPTPPLHEYLSSCAANTFLISLFSFKFSLHDEWSLFLQWMSPLFMCFAVSEQPNIGQQYRLCLLIEWQSSRRWMSVGVLGSPEKIAVDNGQARTKTASANA